MAIQLKCAYLTVPVSNLKRSAEWYGEHSHFTYPDESLQSSYGFMVDDAESAYQYFVNEGIEVGILFEYQGKSFSFYDPDGNFIEIWSLPVMKA